MRTTLTLVIAFAAGVLCAAAAGVRAEPELVDRALVERLVRAEESQTKALEALSRAAERCNR